MRPVAIVGMACRYPDAKSPMELWQTVLARRRAFRRVPAERLPVGLYGPTEAGDTDSTYLTHAAVLEGYRFDRVRMKVSGRTYRSADLAHWLALDVAAQALESAAFPGADGLPLETTGVVLGNSLTGEFSRANMLRLRWPFVRSAVDQALQEEGFGADRRRHLLEHIEDRFKRPLSPTTEESLAGALSNTIAGRVCNHFDFRGGGYTVDGACSSSLLAVATACNALRNGEMTFVLAGGVDLSLDPMELVGFAQMGALAREDMRVFDRRPTGFWPGEGCGIVLLTLEDRARERGLEPLALISGWGVSSDGAGGLTRPSVDGQLLALRRAYDLAGVDVGSVAYFEGHGTGTPVGDATELAALGAALAESSLQPRPRPAVGSIKANIGHTKAAAGAAGLIKATMALRSGIIPPHTGSGDPHPLLVGPEALLRLPTVGADWPKGARRVAGVSAMGFGGINTHVILQADRIRRRACQSGPSRRLLRSPQSHELLCFSAETMADLERQVAAAVRRAKALSFAEMTDMAAALAETRAGGEWRAAVVAERPSDLERRLTRLLDGLGKGIDRMIDHRGGVFLAHTRGRPRIGFLFPGQGSLPSLDGAALAARFEGAAELYRSPPWSGAAEPVATEVAQPAIATASLAVLAVFGNLGLQADVAVGHSLGELVALCWAGAVTEKALLSLTIQRGRIMADAADGRGGMAAVAAPCPRVEDFLRGSRVVLAGLNGPRQTVVSGPVEEIEALLSRMREAGVEAQRLPVSHAFHSPSMIRCAERLRSVLRDLDLEEPGLPVASTVSGAILESGADLKDLIHRQVTSPVRFEEAVRSTGDVDLWIQVGPGRALTALVQDLSDAPAIATDASAPDLRGVLSALAAAFVYGADPDLQGLFRDRFRRSMDLEREPSFLSNPTAIRSPAITDAAVGHRKELPRAHEAGDGAAALMLTQSDNGQGRVGDRVDKEAALAAMRSLIVERLELPPETVGDDARLLSDLHLNSITVGQLVVDACGTLGIAPPMTPTDFADATLAEAAAALVEMADTEVGASAPGPAGLRSWVEPFGPAWIHRPAPEPVAASGRGEWKVLGDAPEAFRDRVEAALSGVARNGTALLVPPPERPEAVAILAGALAQLRSSPESSDLVVFIQEDGGCSSLARSLHLERAGPDVLVVNVPWSHVSAPEWIATEVRAARGFREIRLDEDGKRWEPALRLLPLGREKTGATALRERDVVLITGGGKGITAECALALARETGAAIGLLGRSDPLDPDLQENLRRFHAEGVRVRYVQADVTDLTAVRGAVEQVHHALGPVTAVVHGAGRNVPRLIAALDEEELRRTLAPKVGGFENILRAIPGDQLRLVIAFGSIIARSGLRGEAHYGLANEWLALLAEDWSRQWPNCRTVVMEWSVWAAIGMGARLGRVQSLERAGVAAISLDEGLEAFLRVLKSQVEGAVVITGRTGALPTLQWDPDQLPLLRFLERTAVHYPGVELVAEAELSMGSDPYLRDHSFCGSMLLPGVMGLEAMAQAASAVVGRTDPSALADVRFTRPVVVPEDGSTIIRIQAVRKDAGRVDVRISSSETEFASEHFSASVLFEGVEDLPSPQPAPATVVPIEPASDLYGPLLFHGPWFQRVREYRLLAARESVTLVEAAPEGRCFGAFHPQTLILGDPAVRDAAIHSVQPGVPHRVVLPVGVDRVVLGKPSAPNSRIVRASETGQTGPELQYEVVIHESGRAVETWSGLRLRMVEPTPASTEPWHAALLGPYLERLASAILGDPGLRIDVTWEEAPPAVGGSGRRRRRLGRNRGRRPDGKPEGSSSSRHSRAHAFPLLVSCSSPHAVGCDAEPVPQPSDRDPTAVLGPGGSALAREISRESKESLDVAAIRVWTAQEALKKAGSRAARGLLLRTVRDDGWLVMTCGAFTVTNGLVRVRDLDAPYVVSVASRPMVPLSISPEGRRNREPAVGAGAGKGQSK